MTHQHRPFRLHAIGSLLGAGLALSEPAFAQPEAAVPEPAPVAPTVNPPRAAPKLDPDGRRILEGPDTTLAFKNVTVDQIIPFIVEATGKVVMPQPDVLSRKVTVLNDQPIPRQHALDLVFMALFQTGVAVVETPTTITLRDITEITRQDVPVLGPDESTLERTDVGTVVEKVFALRHSNAKNIGEMLKDSIPDYAKRTVDEDSNQIAVMGNVGLLQRLERLIGSLDRPSAGALQTETFRLKYADATSIKANIEELFGSGSASAPASNSNNQRGNRNQGNNNEPRNQMQMFRFAGQAGGAEAATAASGEIRVSANAQQNSVTVVADPAILAQVGQQIANQWDRPLPEEAVVPKIYDLKNTDPVKVRDLLEGLFGSGASSTAGRTTGGGGNNNQAASAGSSQGVGRLAGQFSFQAIPESSRLVVVAKSPDNIAVIDTIIADLDKPQTAGLPVIIELKHASAEDLAEQLNTLLSQDGTLAQIRRSESGLSDAASSASPFASETTTTDGQATETTTPDTMSFWWQRSRPPTDRRNASNLVGQLRIVPIWRQNAIMVVSPPEYKQSIIDLVNQLDKPGRQVLLAAVVAELSTEDAKSLGIRWSSQDINPTNPDNSVSLSTTATGQRNDIAESLFNTSVLDANLDVNVLLQALAQESGVSILSEPRIFTSDNQEAEFFDGQDIPFITNAQTNDNGNLTQTFDYKAVGIQLRIRPRITVKRDVDLKVNLELSSIVPGQTLFGGFIVERRETTTQLIVKDGQTIVISGILRSEDSDIVRKVPILGDIPVLRLLFKSKERTKTNTELLVFITPIVVDNTDAAEGVNAPYLQRLEQLRRQLGSENPLLSDPGVPPPPPPAKPSEPR